MFQEIPRHQSEILLMVSELLGALTQFLTVIQAAVQACGDAYCDSLFDAFTVQLPVMKLMVCQNDTLSGFSIITLSAITREHMRAHAI